MTVRPTRVRTLGAAAILTCLIAGCSSSKPATTGSSQGQSSPASASSPAPASSPATSTGAPVGAADLKSLLITAADIPVAGFTLVGTQDTAGGQGVTGAFAGASGRALGVTLVVLPSAQAAAIALDAAEKASANEVKNATVDDLGLGDAGKIYQGSSADGSKESSVVVFTEGKVFVTMGFDAAKGDAAPANVIAATVKAQDDKIKANPPS